MKKFLFLLSCLILTACTEDADSGKESKKEINSTALIFEELNNSLKQIPNKRNVTTRGFFNNFKRAITLAGADFAGACGGIVATKEAAAALGGATGGTGAVFVMSVAGVLCGASASILAEAELNQKISIYDNQALATVTTDVYTAATKEIPVDYIQLNFPPNYDYMNILGGMHNVVVRDVYNSMPQAVILSDGTGVEPPTEPGPDGGSGPTTGGTNVSMTTTLATAIPIVSDIEYQQFESTVLESPNYANVSEALLNNISDACDNGAFSVNSFFNNSTISAETERIVTNYYAQLLNEYTESMEDVISVANAYIAQITTLSTITQEEKENLYLMIAISVNSVNFWMNKNLF